MTVSDELACGFGKIIRQMLADDPNRSPTHLIETFLLRAAEQLTLGSGSFDAEAARRHERFAANGTVGKKEHGGLRNVGLGWHFAEKKLFQNTATDLSGFGRYPVGG